MSLQVNPRVEAIRVPVDVELRDLAARISCEAAAGAHSAFQQVIDVSRADGQRAGMTPLTFNRQVLAAVTYPELMDDGRFPADVVMRARKLLEACDGLSMGSYSDSSGLSHVRRSIAEFITRRDGGVPSYAKDIYISAGSQRALMLMMKLLANGEGGTPASVLTPWPCPPSLLLLLDEAGVRMEPYLLAERGGWVLDPQELCHAMEVARGRSQPRALYVSNPGNPTGHVQDRSSMEEVIRFAAAEKLLLLVEEVYQDAVHAQEVEFVSYKKVLSEMGVELSQLVEMVSFHSLSSTTTGECGLRAGYMEILNMDPEVSFYVDTMLCTDICTPIPGQLVLDLMVDPPRPGDPSHLTHTQELLLRRATLSQNAQRSQQLLEALPGLSCQPALGGVYLLPRLHLPSHFEEQARVLQMCVCVLYCRRLLEEEGLLVGVACQHEVAPGRHHFRFSFLLPAVVLEEALSRLTAFHRRLVSP